MNRDEEPCQEVSTPEESTLGHCDNRRSGIHTRRKNKKITKNKRKIIKRSRRRNRI